MKYVFAYGFVIVLVQIVYQLGAFLVTVIVVGSLVWLAGKLRSVIAGILSGLGGVAAAFAFGYYVFRLILGLNSFGFLPLLAVTVPLLIPIQRESLQARLLSEDAKKIRELNRDQPTALREHLRGIEVKAVGGKFRTVGAILGLVILFLWLLPPT